jgi:NitT/TauT family transport system substrate-binding protein
MEVGMGRGLRIGKLMILAASIVAGAAQSVWAAEPLKIGYSDWPGFVAWQVAIDKGWFKEAGVDVQFEWFDYVPSMDAFAAGKIDGVGVTNGDALVMGGTGTKNIMIMLTDYSDGNDMIVAQPGIKSLKELKGKKVGLEVGFVEHLLLLNGLEKSGLTESDVTLVNTKTNETPQVLASGEVAAIGAWQPSSGMAMKQAPGSTPVYTSSDEPGLIYDVITVSPTSLATRRADWLKVIKVWQKVVTYINDPATVDDAVKIMSARDGLKPEEYKPFLKGTKLLDVPAGKKVFVKAKGFGSLYGSSDIANDFNLKYAVYKEKLDVGSFIDPSLTNEQP